VDIVYMATAVVAGFGGSFWLGYRYGVRCRKLPARRFRIANGIGMLIGLVLAVAVAGIHIDHGRQRVRSEVRSWPHGGDVARRRWRNERSGPLRPTTRDTHVMIGVGEYTHL
jgi:hypothetical protein